MTTSSTSLLGLALPVTGELNGTWGDVVNNSLTSLLDTAIAGTTTLSSDADVTLTTTALTTNQARQAVLLCTGNRTSIKTITAPAQSKTYVVINATTGSPTTYAVKIVGAGPTTGVTVPNGKAYLVAWNGSDFVVTGTTTINLTTDVSGTLPIANGGTGQTSYTDGQLLIGNSTGNTLTKATLTAGSGVTITNGSGSINISATGSGGTVTSVTGTSPVVSSGGNTPAISLAANYGDTLNPYASKTASYFLAAPNGTAGVPSFRAVVASDIPVLNQNTTGTAAGLSGSQTANTVYAAPNGSAGTATFRALVAADVPTLNQNTTGTAAGLSATLAIGSGGTGTTTAQGAMNAFAGAVTTGQYLRGNGTNVVMSAIQAGDVPTLNQNTTGSAATVTTTINSGVTATTQTAGDNSTKVATTAYVQTAVSAVGYAGPGGQTFTANGTFTIPTGITKLKITVVGGGGGGNGYGGAGTAGGTSQVASGTQSITTVSASGGAAGGTVGVGYGGLGGVGTNGTINMGGQAGIAVQGIYAQATGGSSILGGGGGGSTTTATKAGRAYGGGGAGWYFVCASVGNSSNGGGGGGAAVSYLTGLTPGGTLAVTVGGAGSGGASGGVDPGGAGAAGVVIFEW